MGKAELLQIYDNKLGLALTHIPQGKKGPAHKGWLKKKTEIKHWLNNNSEKDNVGILHELSGTCCFDIDNLTAAHKNELLEEYIIGPSLSGNGGLVWSSGVKNRIKILYSLPRKSYYKKNGTGWKKKTFKIFKTHKLPGNCGQFRCAGAMDVLPPSVHPTGSTYSWKEKISNIETVPELPSRIVKLFEREYASLRTLKMKDGGYGKKKNPYPFMDVYNQWYMKKYGVGKLFEDILKWSKGAYVPAGVSTSALKRVGSTNRLAVSIFLDADGVERAYNFSDTSVSDVPGGRLLPHNKLIDPYALLALKKGFDEARKYVCSYHKQLKALVDQKLAMDTTITFKDGGIQIDPSSREINTTKGINFKKNGCPFLSLDTMMPPKSNFGRLVKSLMYHQIQVHNPNMAFWYALVLVDYIAGGGYKSFKTSTMSPLYCFTSGTTSDGKTKTIEAGEIHLYKLGGVGNSRENVGELLDGSVDLLESDSLNEDEYDTVRKEENKYPHFTTYFDNKRQIDDAGSVEGIKDLIGKQLGHGCDILYTHDEFGITTSGKGQQRSDEMKGFIMTIKSMGRMRPFRYRLKAITESNIKAGKGTDVFCVHFNYFTSTTDEALKGVITQTEVGQGFTQRFIGGPSITKYNTTRVEALGAMSPMKGDKGLDGAGTGGGPGVVDKAVLKNLKKIIKVSSRCTGLDRMEGGKKIRCTEEVEERILETSKLVGKWTKEGRVSHLKFLENVLPVARVRAIIENPKRPVVTLEYYKWAETVVESSVLFFQWLVGSLTISPNTVKAKLQSLGAVEEHIEKRILDILRRVDAIGYGYWKGRKYSRKLLKKGKGDGNKKRVFTKNTILTAAGVKKYGAATYNRVLIAMIENGLIGEEEVKLLIGDGRSKKCEKRMVKVLYIISD